MRTFNLFISHSWSYEDSYDGLIALLKKRPYFRFRDYSVPQNDPIHNAGTDAELREAIQRQMRPCSVVIIIAGVYATYSKWIKKEIDLAENKPIIAVRPRGSRRISRVVRDAADEIVGWNTESIVDAIRKLA